MSSTIKLAGWETSTTLKPYWSCLSCGAQVPWGCVHACPFTFPSFARPADTEDR